MDKKEVYLIKGEPGNSYQQFGSMILSIIERLKRCKNVSKIKYTITEEAPPKVSIIPFRKEKVAVISLVFIDGGLQQDSEFSFLRDLPGFIGGYDVEEAVPVEYEQTWAMGEKTPGICLLTLFHSKKGLDHDTFIDRWHNSHTPLSLRLHPLWNYIRNVVKGKLTEDSVWYDGIVEEQVKTRRELLNPFIFFGPFFKVPYHMYLVYRDTKSFIDYKRIETFLVNEYLVSG